MLVYQGTFSMVFQSFWAFRVRAMHDLPDIELSSGSCHRKYIVVSHVVSLVALWIQSPSEEVYLENDLGR